MAWDRDKKKKAGKAMTLGGCIYGLLFSLFWCGLVIWQGAYIMLLPGIFFVCMMITRLYACVQHVKADKENSRQYKEIDPWERPVQDTFQQKPSETGYCPYCGVGIQEEFEFCPKCGRRQP